jgi:uncharacterized membrane protein YqgA involved in biofilm formation
MIGTLLNFAAVMVGGTLGLLLGGHLPDRMKTIVISAIGLVTIGIGTAAAIKTENALIPSAVGGVILIGLGLNILQIKRIKFANMLPALLLAPLLVALLNTLGIPVDFGLGGR